MIVHLPDNLLLVLSAIKPDFQAFVVYIPNFTPKSCKVYSGEKLADSGEDLLEHRTDGTDAFDTLYIGCEKFSKFF